MAYKVYISDEAKLDIENSFLYYKSKVSDRVAKNFLTDFRTTLKIITNNPYFRLWYSNFRGKPMRKYPFVIFYLLDDVENIIVVSRVFHTSQNLHK